ncbi:MAG: hypothetical protein JST67_05750 [Bacteroidetes bacterium]|nr:hypothetical protein [Bacteroidota bacterium]
MKILFYIISVFFLTSCFHESYTIYSPNKKESLTLEYTTSIIPNESKYVRLFFGAYDNIKRKEYIKMHIYSGGMDINWGANPITVISNSIIENTIPDSLFLTKKEMTDEETKDFHSGKSLWRSYDFSLIFNGKYEDCKKN